MIILFLASFIQPFVSNNTFRCKTCISYISLLCLFSGKQGSRNSYNYKIGFICNRNLDSQFYCVHAHKRERDFIESNVFIFFIGLIWPFIRKRKKKIKQYNKKKFSSKNDGPEFQMSTSTLTYLNDMPLICEILITYVSNGQILEISS